MIGFDLVIQIFPVVDGVIRCGKSICKARERRYPCSGAGRELYVHLSRGGHYPPPVVNPARGALFVLSRTKERIERQPAVRCTTGCAKTVSKLDVVSQFEVTVRAEAGSPSC